MAGAACKIIINNGTRALSESMERILISPEVLAGRMSKDEAGSLLDRLVNLDLAACDGDKTPTGDSLLRVLGELVKYGIVTDEVWRLYKGPA